jgi:hypothetical protein
MVENAEKTVKKAEDDWATDNDGLASPVAMVIATSIGAGTVNASDRVSHLGQSYSYRLTFSECANAPDFEQSASSADRDRAEAYHPI